jgi:hypothetical protein
MTDLILVVGCTWREEEALISHTEAGQACASEGGWGCCCCCVLLRSAAVKDSPGTVWLEENTLPGVVLGAL